MRLSFDTISKDSTSDFDSNFTRIYLYLSKRPQLLLINPPASGQNKSLEG
jgi:hypothetical protein